MNGFGACRVDLRLPHGSTLEKFLFVWESPTVIITMDAKRRLTVPVAAGDFKPGDTFLANFDCQESEIVFRKINSREDWLAVALACPYPMDDLPPRSRELAKELDL